ncbi:NPC intracellular cholesterol transporter 2-like [Teleopsis dalmanni]|uniref:NPC intracellular cholesterol transporter 2-like n=1 Tax=Teleopsis dalmanni TaxID=139649 RepID=UPI0018CD8962|nr:NPC intracellular cholesterol transporter 2-like [Teleopsis dalmanni]XP_037956843.1 NPC intracellular cholesterol transporter 2-like [Teleopsis dalmanni]
MISRQKIFVGVLLLAIIATTVDALTPVRKCGNGKSLPLSVQVNDCNELPCDFWKGTNTHMAIQFVATKNLMSSIRSKVHVTTMGMELPQGLQEEQSNVCKNLMFGAYCPLYKEEDVVYHLTMSVQEALPEVPVRVEVSLIDETDDEVIACFITDGRVKK